MLKLFKLLRSRFVFWRLVWLTRRKVKVINRRPDPETAF